MKTVFNKKEAYNPPTEYDTSKVYIIRIELEDNYSNGGLLYKIVFRGSPENLANTGLLMSQAEQHLKHENLTGFEPYFPWPKPEDNKDLSERTVIYRQSTL